MNGESELTRIVKPAALAQDPLRIEPSEAERDALAERFSVSAIPAMKAVVALNRDGEFTTAHGTLEATIVQPCAVTGDDLSYDVAEPIALRFAPERSASEASAEEEIELASEELDEISYRGDGFDLGEAIAQTLGLAIDPYREGPGADDARKSAGIVSDEEAPRGPLADALAKLKDSPSDAQN